jgi:hypothetical protein
MSAGIAVAQSFSMRKLRWLSICGVLLAVGCTSSEEDGSVTDDSNEIIEGRGSIERKLDPPIAAPTNALINAKMSDVLTQVKAAMTAGAPEKLGDDCTVTKFKDAKTKKVVVEHVDCKKSALIRVLNEDGTMKAEHSDLNKDGKVDRWAGTSGTIVQLADTNVDGKIDVIVERVDLVKDFSMEGYDETFPKSKFLFRVREDRNRDGKFEVEKLTAKGALPAAP